MIKVISREAVDNTPLENPVVIEARTSNNGTVLDFYRKGEEIGAVVVEVIGKALVVHVWRTCDLGNDPIKIEIEEE